MTPSNMPFADAAGAEQVAQLVAGLVAGRENLTAMAQAELDSALLDLVARTPLALATIMLDARLPKKHPDVIKKLLQRAHDLAPTAIARTRIEDHAAALGLFNFFVRPTTKEAEFLTRAQRAGLDRMLKLARLYFAGGTHAGVSLRLFPLILGPSGTGKSCLARELARRFGLPLFRASYGDWLVTGAKAEPTTLQRLLAAVEKHDRFVVFIDEIDKIQMSSDPWSRALLTELFGVLDRQLSVGAGGRGQWTEEHLHKLRTRVFFVGAATFQTVWEESARTLGFGADTMTETVVDRIQRSGTIPTELMARFNPSAIVLPPYTVDDFRNIASALKLGPSVLDPVAAAESKLNWRAVEACATNAALEALDMDEF